MFSFRDALASAQLLCGAHRGTFRTCVEHRRCSKTSSGTPVSTPPASVYARLTHDEALSRPRDARARRLNLTVRREIPQVDLAEP